MKKAIFAISMCLAFVAMSFSKPPTVVVEQDVGYTTAELAQPEALYQAIEYTIEQPEIGYVAGNPTEVAMVAPSAYLAEYTQFQYEEHDIMLYEMRYFDYYASTSHATLYTAASGRLPYLCSLEETVTDPTKNNSYAFIHGSSGGNPLSCSQLMA